MKRLLLLALTTCLGAGTARADVLTFTAEVHGGGAGGKGVGGDRKDDAFFDGATGGTYGALVGAEILLVDVWIEHNQFVNGDGLSGTWTQFMGGIDLDFDVGGERGDLTKESDKEHWTPGYGELGMAAGFGVATGQQVDPPLDNSEITDKGLLFQVSGGFGYRFNKLWSIGVSVPVQIGYMFKSGKGAVVNDLSTHYVSLQGAALVNMRFTIPL